MSKPEPLTIMIDQTPHSDLNPNARVHHMRKHKQVAALREAASYCALNGLKGGTWAWSGPIIVHAEIYWPSTRRVIDYDNAVASLKPAIDGVFDRIDANDRQMIGVLVHQAKDKLKRGYMVITIEAHPAEEVAA